MYSPFIGSLSNSEQMERLTPKFTQYWANKYDLLYDLQYYEPYIEKARQGNAEALRRVTEWKNVRVSRSGRASPMCFEQHKYKERAFQRLLENLDHYTQQDGSSKLRKDFCDSTPVWSIFWHHVLYGTPIFDRYTNIAFHFFGKNQNLPMNEATVIAPGHWYLYDSYVIWFMQVLRAIQVEEQTVTQRTLDRALISWSIEQSKR